MTLLEHHTLTFMLVFVLFFFSFSFFFLFFSQVSAYSPLGLGFLTGKYDESNLPSGPRRKLAKSIFAVDADASSPAPAADSGTVVTSGTDEVQQHLQPLPEIEIVALLA